MIRTPVESSNLASVGYDAKNKILQVEFKNRAIYNYFKVEQAQFDALMAADSVGKYLNANIKPAHTYELVDPNDIVAEISANHSEFSLVANDLTGRVLVELHFLRFAYELNDTNDAPTLYTDKFGWPAPTQYQASQ